MVNGKARLDERLHQFGAARGVALALEGFGGVIVKRGNHRRLNRAWHDEAGVLAQL